LFSRLSAIVAGNTSKAPIPQDPFNLRAYNYGNADYDTRHYFSADYVWQIPRFWGPRAVFGDWEVSGTIFARSGLPFTVVDGNATSTLGVTTPCLTSSMFSPATTGFGSQRRNQFYGPRYFDTGFTVMKNFQIPRWESGRLGIGLQFFNLFNQPNFDQPVGDVANPQFGSIITTVSTPTSVLGSFLGGDASPRMIQLKARLTF
jgi:hypothetical protein